MNRPLLEMLKDRHAWHLESARKWRLLPPDPKGYIQGRVMHHDSEAKKIASDINRLEAKS